MPSDRGTSSWLIGTTIWLVATMSASPASPYAREGKDFAFSIDSDIEENTVLENDNGVEMVPVGNGGGGQRRQESSAERVTDGPSNERLLCIAFVTFMVFALCQTVAAVVADSEAMMGDSAAMIVDALTYLFNLLAERRKSRFDETWKGTTETDPERVARIKARDKRKMTLQLELIPPLVSVSILLVVTTWILHGSITELLLDVEREVDQQSDPDVNLMLLFSLINLLLDVLNVCCFARAKRLFGYATQHKPFGGGVTRRRGKRSSSSSFQQHLQQQQQVYTQLQASGDDDDDEYDQDIMEGIDDMEGYSFSERMKAMKEEENDDDNANFVIDEVDDFETTQPSDSGEQHNNNGASNGLHHDTHDSGMDDSISENHSHERQEGEEEANLNMCSAYTHVFADTLRSIAVVVAAAFAEVSDLVTSEEADATAAVVVSLLIILSLIPLLRGLCVTFSELRAIQAEERSERMFRPQQ